MAAVEAVERLARVDVIVPAPLGVVPAPTAIAWTAVVVVVVPVVVTPEAAAVVTMVAFKVLAFLGAEVPTDSKIGACLAKLPCFRGTKDVEIGNKA